MLTKKRIAALIIALAMVFTMVFSALFIVRNAGHKCSETECGVCAQISCCISNLNNITPKPETGWDSAFISFALVLIIGAVLCVKRQKTLTELKIKLSN